MNSTATDLIPGSRFQNPPHPNLSKASACNIFFRSAFNPYNLTPSVT